MKVPKQVGGRKARAFAPETQRSHWGSSRARRVESPGEGGAARSSCPGGRRARGMRAPTRVRRLVDPAVVEGARSSGRKGADTRRSSGGVSTALDACADPGRMDGVVVASSVARTRDAVTGLLPEARRPAVA